MKGRINQREKSHCHLFLRVIATAPTFSNHHGDQSIAINI